MAQYDFLIIIFFVYVLFLSLLSFEISNHDFFFFNSLFVRLSVGLK